MPWRIGTIWGISDLEGGEQNAAESCGFSLGANQFLTTEKKQRWTWEDLGILEGRHGSG